MDALQVLLSLFWFQASFLISLSETKSDGNILLRGIFWDVKPFIFTNEKGVTDGIIPMIFDRAQHFCLHANNNSKAIEFLHRVTSREQFLDKLNRQDYASLNANLTQKQSIWVPVMANLKPEWEHQHNVRSFQLMKTSKIAVIVPRHYIDLPSKIIRGLISCRPIFIIGLLMALVFSFLYWLIERNYNDQIPRSFILGCGTSLWWSCVSMTTVGYGDIVPKSALGRAVALTWLFIGVTVACVMTATMSSFVAGLGDFTLYGKDVAVLENSHESKVALMDYRAKVLPAKSYEDALEFVRHGKAFAAMINADVAAWYQDEFKDAQKHSALHVVQWLPANLYIKCLVSTRVSAAVKKLFRCMHRQQDEIYVSSVEHYQRYCHTETLHVGSILEICLTDFFVQVLLIAVCVLYSIGIFYDLFRNYFLNGRHKWRERRKCRQQTPCRFCWHGDKKEDDGLVY